MGRRSQGQVQRAHPSAPRRGAAWNNSYPSRCRSHGDELAESAESAPREQPAEGTTTALRSEPVADKLMCSLEAEKMQQQMERAFAASKGTELIKAVKRGHAAGVQMLLATGVPVNAEDGGSGRLPLHFAAEQGHTAIVGLLCQAGAALDQPDGGGAAPLHLAVASGHMAAAGALLAAGAAVAAADGDGRTALHSAAALGDVPMVESLLAAGAAADRADCTGWTPLHSAASQGHLPVVELLLAAGATGAEVNRAGKRPEDVARMAGRTAVAKALRQHRRNGRVTMRAAGAVQQADAEGQVEPGLEALEAVAELQRENTCLEAQVDQATLSLAQTHQEKSRLQQELARLQKELANMAWLAETLAEDNVALEGQLEETRAAHAELAAAGKQLVVAESTIHSVNLASLDTPDNEVELRRAISKKVAALDRLASADVPMVVDVDSATGLPGLSPVAWSVLLSSDRPASAVGSFSETISTRDRQRAFSGRMEAAGGESFTSSMALGSLREDSVDEGMEEPHSDTAAAGTEPVPSSPECGTVMVAELLAALDAVEGQEGESSGSGSGSMAAARDELMAAQRAHEDVWRQVQGCTAELNALAQQHLHLVELLQQREAWQGEAVQRAAQAVQLCTTPPHGAHGAARQQLQLPTPLQQPRPPQRHLAENQGGPASAGSTEEGSASEEHAAHAAASGEAQRGPGALVGQAPAEPAEPAGPTGTQRPNGGSEALMGRGAEGGQGYEAGALHRSGSDGLGQLLSLEALGGSEGAGEGQPSHLDSSSDAHGERPDGEGREVATEAKPGDPAAAAAAAGEEGLGKGLRNLEVAAARHAGEGEAKKAADKRKRLGWLRSKWARLVT